MTAWNIGLGYRSLYSNSVGYGVNAFFDMSQSSFYRSYTQGGVGAELFANCWIARANGYFPGTRCTSEFLGRGNSFVDGNEIINVDLVRKERSYGGFDLEVGYSIPFCMGEAWAYAGYYYFDTNRAKEVQGPRLRGEVRLFDPQRLFGPQAIIGGQWSYDDLHKSEGSVYVTLRFPLGCSPKQACVRPICRRLYDSVTRNRSIWIERERTEDTFVAPNQILFIDRETGGSGTQTNPLSFPNGPVEAGDEGDILFLLSNTGEIVGPVNPSNDQQVWGFGDTDQALIPLSSGRTLVVNKINPAGIRPTVTNSGDIGINLADRNTISGIAINDADRGIRGASATDTVIDDVAITEAGIWGIQLASGSNLSITNSSIATAAGGFQAVQSYVSGQVTLTNNVLTGDIGTTALVEVANFNGDIDVTFNDNTLSQALNGLTLNNTTAPFTVTGRIDNNSIDSVAGAAFLIHSLNTGGELTVTSRGNTIEPGSGGLVGGYGLTAAQDDPTTNFTVLLQDNQITSPSGSAISFGNGNGIQGLANVTLLDNTSTGAGATPYYFFYSGGSLQQVCLTFEGNSASPVGLTSLDLDPANNAPVGHFTVSPAATGALPLAIETSLRANNTIPPASLVTIGAGVRGGPPCQTP